MTKYNAVPCQCSYEKCRHWHVSPVADIQGVSFTKAQAEAVADLLNKRAQEHPEEERW